MGSVMFTATFNLISCRTIVIFGTLNDGSLLINGLASNDCFSYRNFFQNGVDALSKIFNAFLSKISIFWKSDHPIMLKFASLRHKYLCCQFWQDLSTSGMVKCSMSVEFSNLITYSSLETLFHVCKEYELCKHE